MVNLLIVLRALIPLSLRERVGERDGPLNTAELHNGEDLTRWQPDSPTVTIAETDPGQMAFAGQQAQFQISVAGTAPDHSDITVSYRTQDGTVTANVDYTATDDQALTFHYDPNSGGYDPQTVLVQTTAAYRVTPEKSETSYVSGAETVCRGENEAVDLKFPEPQQERHSMALLTRLRATLAACAFVFLTPCVPTCNARAGEPGIQAQSHSAAPVASAAKCVRKVKIAAIAVATVDGMFEENYARARRLAEISLKDKPDIVLLPEAFAAGYCGKPLGEFAEDGENSPHLAAFRKLSSEGHCMFVVCYLEKAPHETRVRNVAVVYDRGKLLGRHIKHSLWADRDRPYRDEPSQMAPGGPIEVFHTRLGRFAVLICVENMVPANLDSLRGKVDYVLSPYNSEHDLSDVNIGFAKRLGIPSAWVDRTGTVFCGGNNYTTNLGTGGMVDARGRIITRSREGAEEIAVGEIAIPTAEPAAAESRSNSAGLR